jgi:hypothetical protein
MIILQRLSYFIFAVFVSTLFVYLIHRTFTPNDIINIPVLAIIIYLIINYSAEITYEKKLEKFLNQQSDSSISDMMENFDGAGSNLLKRLSTFSEEEESREPNQGDQSRNLPANQIQIKEENKPSVPAPQVFPQEEETRFLPRQPPQQPQEEETRFLPRQPPQQPQEEENRFLPRQPPQQPQEEETRFLPRQPPQQPQEEESRPKMMYQEQEEQTGPRPYQEEEEGKYYAIIGEMNPKVEQAKKKESKRPNVNKYLETKNHQMKNKLVRSINPININVSYNNPVALNGFNNPDTNMNKYRFDSGLDFNIDDNNRYQPSNRKRDCKNCFDNNDSIKDSINSTYYPSYLDNPLNKNVGGTEIPAVRQQSNYEQDRQKQILTEKNSPAPVMFGDTWSEYAPV